MSAPPRPGRGAPTSRAARSVVGGLAMGSAVVTAGAAAGFGESAGYLWGGAAYCMITAVAMALPAAIVIQVLAGQLIAGALLLDPGGPGPLPTMAVVAAVVATSELLGSAARLRTPFETRTSVAEDVREAGVAASLGALAFVAVLMAGNVGGPSGLLAIALASAACAGLAGLLLRRGEGAG